MRSGGWSTGLVLVGVLLVGCGDDGGSRGESPVARESPASTLPADPTDVELAAAAGCDITDDFGDEDVPVGPLRGGAATDGVACNLDGAEVHLFVRAPIGDPGDSHEPSAAVELGSIENIDRLVATGASGDCAAFVAVGESWFAVAADQEVLASVAERLGGGVRDPRATGPPASYAPPGCY